MSLRQLILNHFWLKLISLLLATLIWLAIRANLRNDVPMTTARVSQTEAVREFSQCPVLLMTSASDRRLFKVEPSQVSVTVRGPVASIAQLQESDIHVFVPTDAPRGNSGLVGVEVHAPPGLLVLHVMPDTVTVKLAD